MKNIKIILCALVAFFALPVLADQAVYTFDTQAELDNNFTYSCQNTNGLMELVSSPAHSGMALHAKMGGTSKKYNYLVSNTSFTGISQIECYLATSDKGRTSFAIEVSNDPTFATGVTAIFPLAVFNTFVQNPTNKKMYMAAFPITGAPSGYVRFCFYQPTSSGKEMWIDDLTITYAGSGVTPPTPPTPTLSSDATLSNLTLNGTTIANFNPATTAYTATLTAGTAATVLATTNDENATAVVNWNNDSTECTITVTAEDSTTKVYTISITYTGTTPPTPPTPTLSSDATLSNLTLNGTTIANFNPATTAYTATLTAGTAATVVATTNNGNATAVVNWNNDSTECTVNVTAEDGTTKVYTISITYESVTPPTPPTPPTPTFETNLACHIPEIYETPVLDGGYGTNLTVRNGREYEIYYTSTFKKDGSNRVAVVATEGTPDLTNIMSANETQNSVEATDGWFSGSWTSLSGAAQKSAEEFNGLCGIWKFTNNSKMSFHIKGYDQFRLFGKDNNATASKNKHFVVTIDGVEQTMTYATTGTVRSFDMTSGEHLIEISCLGSSNNELYGFSLRLSNDPRIKYYDGNDSTQVVHQTQALAPIEYVLHNTTQARVEWLNQDATGIALAPVSGDTIALTGTASCPVGQYAYKVIALNQDGTDSPAFVTGQFSVVTAVLPNDTNACSVWINDPMEPVVYHYDALNDADITLAWDTPLTGVTATQDNENNTFTIAGTPSAEGTYTYTLSAVGGNTISGTITVLVPDPIFEAPADSITKGKATRALTPVVWTLKFAQNATVTGLPNGITGHYSNGTVTISGTPAAETSYPKTYTYTITAAPLYTGKKHTTATGKIIVLDPAAKAILYLYQDQYQDGVYDYINARYDVTAREAETQLRAQDQYNNYDLVAISESVDANNGEVLSLINTLPKPVLSFKNFTYTTSRLNMGYPDNGSVSNTAFVVTQPQHPIFNGLHVSSESSLTVLDTVLNKRGLMPVEMFADKGICLATALKRGDDYYSDGERACAIHEISAAERGAKYLLFPMGQESSTRLTANGKTLLGNCLTYLLTPSTTFAAPELRITSFQINGIEGVINEQQRTIRIALPESTDVTACTPTVKIAGVGTFVSPNDGDTVDLSDTHYGVTYTVTDFVRRKSYQVIAVVGTGLEEIGLDGMVLEGNLLRNGQGIWVRIYDALGQLITLTNSDYDFTALPHGMYLVAGQNGSLKVLR